MKLFLSPNTVIEKKTNTEDDERGAQQWVENIRRLAVTASDAALTYFRRKNNQPGSKSSRMTDAFIASYQRFQKISRSDLDGLMSTCNVNDQAAMVPFNSLEFVLLDQNKDEL